MEIREIEDKNTWNTFVLAQDTNTFLHSWEWKLFQEHSEERVVSLGFYKGEELVAVALLITVHAKRGTHYLCPHGPIVKNAADMKEVLSLLKARQFGGRAHDRAVCLRIAPLVVNTSDSRLLFEGLRFRPSPMHVHAELTWVLDISHSEEQIVLGMRKTTRHAIHKATKEGVTVKISKDTATLERFWPLYEQTKNRHGFVPFSKADISEQVAIFGESNMMFFAIATYKGEDVAAAICFQFGKTVFYYHGASKKISSTVPAAQLLQWEAIREAKKWGATKYNFWGIARDDQPTHPFAGITVFKKGFGGYSVDYMHAQDYPLSWKYWILWAIEMWRKKKRGF
ncbi:MAG: peptidoglycan bridge formation glycyltransferase FemA/FemB family protein [bacterium]|nr:peptidoglycan bridge formation glycyltransferase FemA/FemB family protein [bacterium]